MNALKKILLTLSCLAVLVGAPACKKDGNGKGTRTTKHKVKYKKETKRERKPRHSKHTESHYEEGNGSSYRTKTKYKE